MDDAPDGPDGGSTGGSDGGSPDVQSGTASRGPDDGGTFTLEFVEEGRTVECAPDEYVLDAALDAGIDVQYSCLMGVCTICSARIEGEFDQTEGAALTPEEVRRGLGLTCIAYPRSDLRLWTGEGP